MSSRTVTVRFKGGRVVPGRAREAKKARPRPASTAPWRTPRTVADALGSNGSNGSKRSTRRSSRAADRADLRELAAEAKKLRAHLRKLTGSVMLHLAYLDAVMKLPPSEMKGRVVAQLANLLDLANDHARHFALGVPLKSLARTKPKASIEPEQLAELRDRLKEWVGGG